MGVQVEVMLIEVGGDWLKSRRAGSSRVRTEMRWRSLNAERGGSGTNVYLTNYSIDNQAVGRGRRGEQGKVKEETLGKDCRALSTCLWVGRLASMDVQAKPCTLVAQSQR